MLEQLTQGPQEGIWQHVNNPNRTLYHLILSLMIKGQYLPFKPL